MSMQMRQLLGNPDSLTSEKRSPFEHHEKSAKSGGSGTSGFWFLVQKKTFATVEGETSCF